MIQLPMKLPSFGRLAAAAAVIVVTALGAGCSTGHSDALIPPNWYDSAYYKDDAVVSPAPPNTAPTAGPGVH